MLRQAAIAAALGLVGALFALSLLTGSPGAIILLYIAQLPIFVAGLWLGAKAAVVAGAIAGGVTAAVAGPMLGALQLVGVSLPAMLMTGLALRRRQDAAGIAWYPAGRLVGWLVGLGMAGLVACALYFGGEGKGMAAIVQSALERALASAFVESGGMAEGVAQAQASAAASKLTPVFAGMVGATWLGVTALNGILAQGALARFGLNRRPAPDIATLALPEWMSPALAAAALGTLVGGGIGYIAGNLLPIIAVGFIFGGLAVVHALARRYGSLLLLIAVYASLLLGWPLMVVGVGGIVDQWFGLRRRFAGPGIGKENNR
jgi:hypothetical protein